MERSLGVIRLAAGLPERLARRIQLLLASVPDPRSRPAIAWNASCTKPPPPSTASPVPPRPCAAQSTFFPTAVSFPTRCSRIPSASCRFPTPAVFTAQLSAEEYEERLFDFLGKERRDMPSAVDLARFRRRQLLRIVLRDVLGVAALAEVTEELSNLADAILDFTYRRIRARLVARARRAAPAPMAACCGFSVISLGKLGGKELNYSSDIDLMFVYGGNGETDGPVAHHQQGILQEDRQRIHRAAFHLHRRRPVLPRGSAPAARWHPGRDLHLRRRSARLLRRTRARLGKADADQSARLRRRTGARRGAAGVRRAADLPELPGFPRRGSGVGNPPAHQRKSRRQEAPATPAWISS